MGGTINKARALLRFRNETSTGVMPHRNSIILIVHVNKKPSNLSRRNFVQQASLLPALAFLPTLVAQAATGVRPPTMRASADIRYGLFFDSDKLESLRSLYNNNPAFVSLKEEAASFDYEAEYKFLEEEIQYHDHLIDLARLGRNAPTLSFHYLMTGDEDAGQMAKASVDAIMKFEKWDYFLEDNKHILGIQRASSSVVATALCADWLGDMIDQDTADLWIETMGERGCEACFLSVYGMRYPDRVKGWTMDRTSGYFEHRPYENVDLSNWPHILDTTNLKAVPASALAIGAAAYESHFGRSEDSDRWIEQAEFSITSFENIYAEDGSYDENLSYANYTSEHLMQGVDILSRLRGIELQDKINWVGFVDFMYGLSLPTDEDPRGVVTFGDTSQGVGSGVCYWIAGQFHDPRAAWFGRNLSKGDNLWSVIWHSDMPGLPPASGPSVYRSKLDWITARAGYSTDDLVVAMRSGPPANHEHSDRNSIMVKKFGEILIDDPYRPPYSNTDPSWPLRLSTGHSALTIDGKGHQYHDGSEGTNPSDAHAKIVRVKDLGDVVSWSSDATQPYNLVNEDVSSAVRTIVVLHDGSIVFVIDKVIKSTTPSVIGARYFARNTDKMGSIETSDGQFRIIRPRAGLTAWGYSPSGLDIKSATLDIDPERAKDHPYADFTTRSKSTAPLLVSVLVPFHKSGGNTRVTFSTNDEGTITARVANKRVQIYDRGHIPEVEVD